MRILITLCIITTFNAYALKSPFKSSIPGIELPNSHCVGKDEQMVRGMSPAKYLNDLLRLGITDVLIFKNQTKGEVDREKFVLKELGIQRVYDVHFFGMTFRHTKKPVSKH